MQLNSPPSSSAGHALKQDAERLQQAVAGLVRVYQFRDRDRICCHDISVTQCYALEALVEWGGMRSQALAERLRLDKSTTTRVVDALERKGYVERRADPEDARARQLRVTRSGRALYQRIRRDLVDQHAQLVADLEPELRAAAAEVIERLARAAEARFVSGVSVGCVEQDAGTSAPCSAARCG